MSYTSSQLSEKAESSKKQMLLLTILADINSSGLIRIYSTRTTNLFCQALASARSDGQASELTSTMPAACLLSFKL